MRYKVTFRKRFNERAQPADEPASMVDPGDGVILDAEIVECVPPRSLHVAEEIPHGSMSADGEDDGFLAFGHESWVYDVAEGREREFKEAVINTELALAIEEVPDEPLTTGGD